MLTRLILSLAMELHRLFIWGKRYLQPTPPFAPTNPTDEKRQDTIMWLNELCDMCFSLVTEQKNMYDELIRSVFLVLAIGGVMIILWSFYSDAILDYLDGLYDKYIRHK